MSASETRCLAFFACAVLLSVTGCTDPFAIPAAPEQPLTSEELALKKKFRGLRGGEIYVDGFGRKECVAITDEKGGYFYGSGVVSPETRSIYGYTSRFGVPRTLRVTWREGNCRMNSSTLYDGGTIIGDYTVQIASRLPDDIVTAATSRGETFRLKIRLHDEGPLIGWDLKGPMSVYFAGGDFQEARVVYEGDLGNNPTKRWVKGWYIHPKTRERIETDF
jgi:hypothetical protein